VRFEFRSYPFLREDSTWAAEAALCASDQEAFWPYHDTLVANPGSYSKANLKQYADMLGLDTASFDDCVDSGRYTEEVQNGKAEGEAKGITKTPTVFINGQKIEGPLPFENFQEVIEQELARSS
jgi:protein-disulfide isomerase